jgi:uncharacterized membrane protein
MLMSLSLTAPALAATGNNGFVLAYIVMALLIVALLYALSAVTLVPRGSAWPLAPTWMSNLLPILSIIGLGVALYLTYVETHQVSAVCGPVGDCNAVQSSPYARLFGVLPVGIVGAAGWVAIIAAWVVHRTNARDFGSLAGLALLGLALFGVLFTIYLTYLELAVIHAVCIWCLTNAVLMALVLILSAPPATQAMLVEEAE